MENIKGFSSDNGVIKIDTGVWMRPKTACEYLRNKGISVSYALMNYWKNEGKIQYIRVEELENLTLVNIETIPEEIGILIKT